MSQLATDEELAENVQLSIKKKLYTAEYAVYFVSRNLMKTLEVLDDEYIRQRARDIEEVADKIILKIIDIKDNVIKINFIGNGFLHNMVRIIVAMLIEVGNERLTIEELQLAMENKDRKFAPKLAPANGLYLMEVYY